MSRIPYRPEVDGLRAVAVAPVILFHAGFETFSGGYVGVDVFFVISGYLITSLLLAELDATGRLSIRDFYERRARRILPALFFVLAVTLPVAAAVMLPFEFEAYGRTLLAAGLFVSNVELWQQGGYFAGPAEENPLLHTWSLSVEEQFYLLFPLVVLVAWRMLGKRGLAGLVLAGLLASLALAEWGALAHPAATFYLLPARAWELAVGVLVALGLHRRPLPSGRWRGPLALTGLGLIGWSVAAFDAGTPFPGLWTLFPVGGAALVLLFASPGTLACRLLSLAPVVGLGLISYSAYLWHQPIFAFARLMAERPPGPALMAGLAAASIPLGWLTWRFVERPFRDRRRVAPRRIFAGAGAGLAIVVGVGLVIVATNGFLDRYPPHQHALLAQGPAERGAYVKERYTREVLDAPFDGPGRRLLIVGDSFSQDFYNMIREVGAFPGYQISADHIPARCQIYLGPAAHRGFIDPSDHAHCGQEVTVVNDSTLARARRADVVVFAASWQEWAAERLNETLDRFGFRPDQAVFVIGRKQFGEVDVRALLDLSPEAVADWRVTPGQAHRRVNRLMRRTLPADVFIDLQALVCETPRACPQFTPDGALLTHDGSHLTRAGARHVGRLLFSRTPLKAYAPHPETAALQRAHRVRGRHVAHGDEVRSEVAHGLSASTGSTMRKRGAPPMPSLAPNVAPRAKRDPGQIFSTS